MRGVPLPPHNITISHILDDSAVVSWKVYPDSDEIKHFGLLHCEIGGNSKTITNLENLQTSHTIKDLHAETEYLVYMWAVNDDGESDDSEPRKFKTDTHYNTKLKRRRNLTSEEIFFLMLVFSIWVVVVILFFRQWGAIRDLQPGDTMYRQAPKNLKSVEVVKNAKDSVIYHTRPKSIVKKPRGSAGAATAMPYTVSRADIHIHPHPRASSISSKI
ncbi:fibronectin type III domain-containing protein 5-like [Glandiceps talaboti]